jgi:signal transduction histidine kinase
LLTLLASRKAPEQRIERGAGAVHPGTPPGRHRDVRGKSVRQVGAHWSDCPGRPPGEINAALLEQAVINLLDNAIKYSNRGAVVEAAACEGRTCACVMTTAAASTPSTCRGSSSGSPGR